MTDGACRYYGYALQSSTGSVLFPLLLIMLLAVIGILAVLNHAPLAGTALAPRLDKKAWETKHT